jgi:hypothetical protein
VTVGPGVHNLTAAEYHADPVEGGSLSSTGARRILDTCPAKFRHWQLEGEERRTVWDEGTAAHQLVLGAGPELVKVPGTGAGGENEWRNAADKEKVAEARLSGAIPLKPRQWDMVHGMAAALARHKLASALLSADQGVAEQTIVWQDPQTGVMCRALLDQLRHPTSGSRWSCKRSRRRTWCPCVSRIVRRFRRVGCWRGMRSTSTRSVSSAGCGRVIRSRVFRCLCRRGSCRGRVWGSGDHDPVQRGTADRVRAPRLQTPQRRDPPPGA